MQALILVGGEGTRLRPLTSNLPKPVVTLVDRPFMHFMLEWLRSHGVDDVVLSCGFRADAVRAVLGDGSELGIRVRYVEEPKPLGTGGALKYAEELLDERFLMLNGDVLTDIDLTRQLEQHARTGARATIALIGVEDPSAYGLVRQNDDNSVKEFLEKPGSERPINTNLVNAGAYVLERDVLAEMAPAGTNISIERDVFPRLVGHGLYGCAVGAAYWVDIGTPARYLQATFDILEGRVRTEIGERLRAASLLLVQESQVHGQILPPVLVGPGCQIEADASVGGLAVIGRNVKVGEGAYIERSVVMDGATIGPRTRISGAIVGPGVSVGERTRLEGGGMLGGGVVMLGEGVALGRDNFLTAGARIFPDVQLPDGAIRF